MLKLSLKEGQYVNIGDDIRIVFAGGIGKHCRLLIDAPKELNIARSNNEPDPAKRKDTYYPDPEISNEAQKEIQRISAHEPLCGYGGSRLWLDWCCVRRCFSK